MTIHRLATLWLFGLMALTGNVYASTAWWAFCDWCANDAAFRNQALVAPVPHEIVYVSNRITNETRKYNRLITIEFPGDDIQQTVFVQEATLFAGAEKAAFDNAIEKANITLVELARNSLVAVLPSLNAADSTVEDISLGAVNDRLIVALEEEVERRGLLPDRLSVSRAANIDILGVGGGGSGGDEVRIKAINIIVSYADGSSITVRRKADGLYVNWTVLDAQGNEIPVNDSANGAVLDADAIALVPEFSFGTENSLAVGQFVGWIRANTSLLCSSRVESDSFGDRLVVTCRSQ